MHKKIYKGRGASSNPDCRYQSEIRDSIDDEWYFDLSVGYEFHVFLDQIMKDDLLEDDFPFQDHHRGFQSTARIGLPGHRIAQG